jgi:uncharacterized damage-inducible protein DinB
MPTTLPQTILEELDRELAVTRKVLERVPDDKFDYQPHPKSMKMGTLASHIVNLLLFKQLFVQANERDFLDQSAPKPPPSPTTTAELLERFDQFSANLRESLQASSDEKLAENFQLRRGEQVLLNRPKGAALRVMGLNHSIHHRGQLTMYLRLLDIPVPGIYGPSADEPGIWA